jgi:hypothetical protein
MLLLRAKSIKAGITNERERERERTTGTPGVFNECDVNDQSWINDQRSTMMSNEG